MGDSTAKYKKRTANEAAEYASSRGAKRNSHSR